jgi:hypothetical protein
LLDEPRRLDEVHRVVVMLFDAGGDGEDVGVEDDVLGRHADLLGQQLVRPLADAHLVVDFDRLALFVERHHDGRGAVLAAQSGAAQELRLAVLHADRVDDALALRRLEPRFEHRPLAGVDHHRHGRDVCFSRNQAEKLRHHRLAVEQRLVHVHVDDVSAALDLLDGDLNGFFELFVLDELGELLGTGDVRPLADHQEVAFGAQLQWLRAAKPQAMGDAHGLVRLKLGHAARDRGDVCRRRAAAAAEDVQPALFCELADHRRHLVGAEVELAHLVRQARVGVAVNARRRHLLQRLDVRPHHVGAQRAVHAHGQQGHVGERVPERLDRLSRHKRRPAAVKCARGHHGHAAPRLVEVLLDGEQARLEVERVDERFRQQDVDARLDERLDLRVVRRGHLVERRAAVRGVVDFRADRGLLGRRADRARDESRPLRRALGPLVGRPAGTCHGRVVDFANQLDRQAELLHADRARAERVRFDDIRPCLEVPAMDRRDFLGVGQAQDVGEVLEVLVVIRKPLAAHGGFVEPQGLNLGPHGPVENQNPLVEQRLEFGGAID